MRISDWSSDVCSSDLVAPHAGDQLVEAHLDGLGDLERTTRQTFKRLLDFRHQVGLAEPRVRPLIARLDDDEGVGDVGGHGVGGEGSVAKIVKLERSEEHTSELQSLMRISYAGYWLKKKMWTHSK